MKCELCKQKINESLEKYVQQIDWNKKEKIRERWFHLICWNNFHREKIKSELQEKIKKLMGNLNFGMAKQT